MGSSLTLILNISGWIEYQINRKISRSAFPWNVSVQININSFFKGMFTYYRCTINWEEDPFMKYCEKCLQFTLSWRQKFYVKNNSQYVQINFSVFHPVRNISHNNVNVCYCNATSLFLGLRKCLEKRKKSPGFWEEGFL